jgi:hypothetical protein
MTHCLGFELSDLRGGHIISRFRRLPVIVSATGRVSRSLWDTPAVDWNVYWPVPHRQFKPAISSTGTSGSKRDGYIVPVR